MTQNFDWMKSAPCVGKTELFFPPATKEQSRAKYRRELEAKRLCKGCDVLEQCRNYARSNDEMGIWGGETERERWEAGFMRGNAVFRRSRLIAESRARQREKRLLLESQQVEI